MKMREWILDGTATNGDITKPVKLHTSPDASMETTYKKMCATVPEAFRFCVHIRKGKIVEL